MILDCGFSPIKKGLLYCLEANLFFRDLVDETVP